MATDMNGKGLVFVRGHRRPTVAPLAARYVLRHPDGSPVRALSRHLRGGFVSRLRQRLEDGLVAQNDPKFARKCPAIPVGKPNMRIYLLKLLVNNRHATDQ